MCIGAGSRVLQVQIFFQPLDELFDRSQRIVTTQPMPSDSVSARSRNSSTLVTFGCVNPMKYERTNQFIFQMQSAPSSVMKTGSPSRESDKNLPSHARLYSSSSSRFLIFGALVFPLRIRRDQSKISQITELKYCSCFELRHFKWRSHGLIVLPIRHTSATRPARTKSRQPMPARARRTV
jgi:hypothetical protein